MLLGSVSVLTQQRPVVTTITGHVVKAERLGPNDTGAKLVVPAGFEVGVFATGAWETESVGRRRRRHGLRHAP
jgi:hypothetical protein